MKVISLFSGCGGFDLGFIESGYEVIWANDIDKNAMLTYTQNIGKHFVLDDITKIPSCDIPSDSDVLIGGFPCQGFSIANSQRSMDDERNYLYKEMLRVIKDTQPKFFVAENVKGLLSMQNGLVFQMILNDFKELGYSVNYKILKASDYGVPQHRERIFIIGNRLGLQNPFPTPTHGSSSNLFEQLKPYVTVENAIGHLSEIRIRDHEFNLDGKLIHNHIARTNVSDKFWSRKHNVSQSEICDYLKQWKAKSNLTTKQIESMCGYEHTAAHWFRKDKYGTIPSVDDWWQLKRILRFDDTYDVKVTEMVQKTITYDQSLRISNWTTPSDTITATMPEIHPNKKRRLSVRECAILQTFPDDFIFHGSIGSMYRQIGNAVPVLLSYCIAEEIKRAISML